MIEALPILAEPSASSEPGEGSLDDPSFGQDDEALGLIGAFDDLDVHALESGPQRILELRPLISAIGVQLQKEGMEAEQCRHQEHAPVAVLNIGAMHDGVHQEALCVDKNMPLQDASGTLRAILECKKANDGGTARDKAARFAALRNESVRLGGIPVFAVLAGLGWRRTTDALGPVVRDTDGRAFTVKTLNSILTVEPLPSLVNTALDESTS